MKPDVDTSVIGVEGGLVEWVGSFGDDVHQIPIQPVKVVHDGAVIEFP